MDRSEITAKLKGMIEEMNEVTIKDADEDLDIDSFTMMMVISFVDEEMKIKLDMETLDFDAFTSLDTLTDLVLAQS